MVELLAEGQRPEASQLSPSPAETATTGAHPQNRNSRLCKALYTSRKALEYSPITRTISPFNPRGNVIVYPKGMSPPAASSFPALKVGGCERSGSIVSHRPRPSLSELVSFFQIFPSLGFGGTAFPWRSLLSGFIWGKGVVCSGQVPPP